MLERFSRETRRTVVAAREAARRLGAEQVEPEHLLLALAEGCDPAARAIAEAGLDSHAIETALEADLAAMLEIVGVPPSVLSSAPARPRARPPDFSLQAKGALERALREALARGDRRIGPEHVLLGTLRPPAPALGRVLAHLGVEAARLAELVQVEAAAGRR